MLTSESQQNVFRCDDQPIVIASAALFEAKPLLQKLSQIGQAFTYLEVGIGAIDSAIISARCRELIRGRDVIFLGTCGSTNPSDIGKTIHFSSVEWKPTDSLASISYQIGSIERPIKLSGRPFFKSDLIAETLSCGPCISKSTFRGICRFENIESYSVASAWNRLTSSFTLLVGVTNEIGPDSHDQWAANHLGLASKAASQFLLKDL